MANKWRGGVLSLYNRLYSVYSEWLISGWHTLTHLDTVSELVPHYLIILNNMFYRWKHQNVHFCIIGRKGYFLYLWRHFWGIGTSQLLYPRPPLASPLPIWPLLGAVTGHRVCCHHKAHVFLAPSKWRVKGREKREDSQICWNGGMWATVPKPPSQT